MTKRTTMEFKMATGALTIIVETVEAIVEEHDGCVLVTHNDVYRLTDNYYEVLNKVFPQ